MIESSLKPAQPDPRRNAFRPDLASESLRGRVTAQQFTQGTPAQVLRAAVPLRSRPDVAAALETEALFGEIVTVYDASVGWAWVQLVRDGYVGYLPTDTLTEAIQPVTHRVKAIGTFLYPVPDIKSPPIMHLSLGARLPIAKSEGSFSQLTTGGYVFTRHLLEIDRFERDFVDVAERFMNSPYLWGGRTRVGLDCSALIQLSLDAAGIPCPRDSDMQQAELGTAIPVPADYDGLKRGDLVFWKGHVGVMGDGLMLLHANAHHMAVSAETLPEVVARIQSGGSDIATVKRLPGLSA
jgi:cell wall-associated NlpC family hydrolase